MSRFFIEKAKISGASVAITGPDVNHIRNVLRMKAGDTLVLFDEAGFDHHAKIVTISSRRVEAVIYQNSPSRTEPQLIFSVAQAYLKGRKMDTIARQITELGVTDWIPFTSARSVATPDHRRYETRLDRWEKIAAESLKQCGRNKAPAIWHLKTFEDVLSLGKSSDVAVVFWEKETTVVSRMNFPDRAGPVETVLAVLGPEGGFTEEEIKRAGDSGFRTAGLGPRILKADTATIVACTIIQYLFGDMG
jgi:16S rRNA (uracil1498-N3)-methyltransferase